MVEPDPVLALLGVPGEDSPLDTSTVKGFITLLACRLILLKQPQPLTYTTLIKDVVQHLKLEKLDSCYEVPLRNFIDLAPQ